MAPEPLVLRRVLEKVHDFLDVLLRFIAPGDVVKPHLVGGVVKHSCLTLTEGEGAALAALHLTHEENPYADQKQHREPAYKKRLQERRFLFGLTVNLHAVFTQIVHHPEIARTGDRISGPVGGRHGELSALHVHAADAACLGVSHKLRVTRLFGRRNRTFAVKLPKHGKEHKGDQHPDRDAPQHPVVQNCPLSRRYFCRHRERSRRTDGFILHVA